MTPCTKHKGMGKRDWRSRVVKGESTAPQVWRREKVVSVGGFFFVVEPIQHREGLKKKKKGIGEKNWFVKQCYDR